MTGHANEKLRAIIAGALDSTLLHAIPVERDDAVQAIVALFTSCEWGHSSISVGTYDEPDRIIPVRYLRLEAGREQGELHWPQHGRAT